MQIRVLAHAGGQRSDENARRGEPLTFGVPLPRGAVKEHMSWTFGRPGATQAAQVRVLDRWADGSARWALVDVQAEIAGAQDFFLEVAEHSHAEGKSAGVTLTESNGGVAVNTGAARFQLRAGGCFPFDTVEIDGTGVLVAHGSGLTLTDAQGIRRHAEIRSVDVEERGPLRSVVKVTGRVPVGRRRLDLIARIHFFAGMPTVRVLVTLTNSDRARHRGGFWDLGDPGSILIKDASVSFALPASAAEAEVYASPEIGAPWARFETPFELYQDSSGGEHWQSSNHINRERHVPNTFRGYRLRAGGRAQTGLRATPIVALARGSAGVAVTTPYFWQNFPKAIEADGGTLVVRLFPGQYGDVHELQGGEQKTHELYVSFGPDAVTSVPLAWCRTPTIAGAAPEWCLASEAVPFLAPLDRAHTALVNSAIEGPDRFELKRERIDEYGWRHFGEIYGDHEAVRHKGSAPLVSHYNNQYDPVAGFAQMFLRTGDPRWWHLMSELARHVVDIDVYHTSRDKWAYNHGMFWHTYHYGDADTATHRTFPLAARGRTHGGGPSADHNYTTGLMLQYFLTGDDLSRDAVVDLARYVVDLDDGRKTMYRWLDPGDTGRAALSAAGYYGPGRGPANSLSALLDGYRLSGDQSLLAKAEQLLRRVVHPDDDIAARQLDVPEQRWFYTMFLQALGRYLRSKAERGELDAMYAYGRASLQHYARWMAAHEYPYLEKPEKLEFPTETWAAQDIRKSDVFYLAAPHATASDRGRFIERGRYFHKVSVETLTRSPTRALARPVVVLLTSGVVEPWWKAHAEAVEPDPATSVPLGSPEAFVPQRTRAERRAAWAGAGAAAIGMLLIWLALR